MIDFRYPSVLHNPSILARLDVLQRKDAAEEEVGFGKARSSVEPSDRTARKRRRRIRRCFVVLDRLF